MGLANLWNPQLDNWDNFWFQNWIDHQIIQQAILKKKKVNQELFIIVPWWNYDAAAILQRHQQYHNNMNTTLNLTGDDLSEINFKNPQAVSDWGYQHFQEHLAAHAALNI